MLRLGVGSGGGVGGAWYGEEVLLAAAAEGVVAILVQSSQCKYRRVQGSSCTLRPQVIPSACPRREKVRARLYALYTIQLPRFPTFVCSGVAMFSCLNSVPTSF